MEIGREAAKGTTVEMLGDRDEMDNEVETGTRENG